MAWAISTRDLTSIRSYAAALRHFNDTRPFRDSPHRPLGSRRAQHKALVMRNDGSEAIACRLYQTDMVTYFPDGTVKIAFHDSNSSRDFASCYVPPGVRVTSNRSRMGLSTKGWDEFLRNPRGTLDFKEGVLLNPEAVERFTKVTLDRKASAAVRKVLKPFDHWARVLLKLKGGQMDIRDNQRFDKWRLRGMLAGGEIPQEHYLSLLSSSADNWRQTADDRTLLDIRQLAYKAAGAFIEEPLPLGAIPQKNRY